MVFHSEYRGNYKIALALGIVILLVGVFLVEDALKKAHISVDVEGEVIENYSNAEIAGVGSEVVKVRYFHNGKDYLKNIEVTQPIPQVGEYIRLTHEEKTADFSTWKGALIAGFVGIACFYAGIRGLLLAKKELDY